MKSVDGEVDDQGVTNEDGVELERVQVNLNEDGVPLAMLAEDVRPAVVHGIVDCRPGNLFEGSASVAVVVATHGYRDARKATEHSRDIGHGDGADVLSKGDEGTRSA